MGNSLTGKVKRAATFFLPVIIAIVFGSCTKTSSPVSDNGSLSDPSIQPKVVFTLPGNGGTGPFDVYNTGDGFAKPSFVVQFNKLMSTYSFQVGDIKCSGFDRPVAVLLHRNSSTIVYGETKSAGTSSTAEGNRSRSKPDKTTDYSDVLQFDIVDSIYATYGYGGQMPYAIGKTYTVTIDTSLRDINGNHIQSPYTFSFTPEPRFRVIGSYPSAGQQNVPIFPNSYLRLTFNSPIKASTISQITITPALNGSWILYPNDSTRVYFLTTDSLKYNTTYTIRVPGSVSDNYGHQIGNDFTETFSATPFKVTYSYPTNGSTGVSPSSNLNFQASGPLDTASLRTAFSISPSVAGTILYSAQNPSAFSFVPAKGLSYNTKYTVGLSTSLKAKDGTQLAVPFTSIFTTTPFEVTGTYPGNGSTNVQAVPSINISLSGAIDSSTVRAAFSISPYVSGSLTYGPMNSIVFTPVAGFAMGTTYTITLTTALKALDGTSLSSPYTLTFSTMPFQVSYTNPQDGETNWPVNQWLTVNFNSIVDTGSVRKAFTITPAVAGSFGLYYYTTENFTFSPATQFAVGTTYRVTISTAMKSHDGSSLAAPYSFSFTTIPFGVTQMYPSDGSYGTPRSTYIQVSCNAPLDTSTIRTAFSVNPAVSGTFNYYNSGSGQVYFVFRPSSQLAANTKYTATVSNALKSSDGATLSQTYSSSFTTGQY